MKISLLRATLVAVSTLAFTASLGAQAPVAPRIAFPAPSPATTLKQRVGVTDIEIAYARPSLRGRVMSRRDFVAAALQALEVDLEGAARELEELVISCGRLFVQRCWCKKLLPPA